MYQTYPFCRHKKFFLSFILFIGCSSIPTAVFSQDKLFEGYIYDSVTRKPIADVMVSIGKDRKVSVKTNTGGYFEIRASATLFDLSLTGYHGRSVVMRPVSAGQSPDTILLRPFNSTLKTVTVTSRKQIITEKVNKIIYSAQDDPENKTQSLFEMLRKVPLISFDENDKIKLKGNSDFKVLINGRLSAMVVHNVEAALKLIPASTVKTIEVYTIVPAKYDAEGLGGLINIETVRKVADGYTAGVSGVYGNLNSNANANLMWKQGKLSVSAAYGNFTEYPPRKSEFNYILDKTDNVIIQKQDDSNTVRSSANTGTVSINYEFDSLNLLNLSGDGTWMKINNGIRLNNGKLDPLAPGGYYNTTLNKQSAQNDNGKSFNLNYQRGFRGNREHLLTVSLNWLDRANTQHSVSAIEDQARDPGDGVLSQFNREKFLEKSSQLDYTRPLKTVTVETGIKYVYRDNYSNNFTRSDSNYLAFFPTATGITDSFDYTMKIVSVYNSYLVTRKKFSINAGIRYEHTSTKGQPGGGGDLISHDYSNLIPSIAVQRKLDKYNSITMGYTRRIRRPSIWQLNPFVDMSDPAHYISGNPYLDPVVNNDLSFSFSSTKRGYLRTSLDYIFASNTIQRIIQIGKDSITRSSFYNIGKTRSVNLNLTYTTNLTKQLDLNMSGELDYIWLRGVIDSRNVGNSGIQGNYYFYLTLSLKKGWKTSANAGIYSPSILLQGKSNTYFYNSLTQSKSFKNGLYMVAVSVTNPFQKYRSSEKYLTIGDYSQYFESRNYNRNFSLRCFLNFGQLKARQKAVKHKIRNNDVIERDNGGEKTEP